MKKKSKKGYKLSEETVEKLKIQAEIKEKEKKEEESKLSKRELKKREKESKKKNIKDEKMSIPKMFETIFCIVYLGFLGVCMWKFFNLTKSGNIYLIFGCLTTILFFGDSFHLIPRIIDNMKRKGISDKDFWFGLGSQISSITMTWFYLLLYFIYKKLFPQNLFGKWFEIAIYVTVGLRIFICLLPQNKWYSEDKSTKLSIFRNLIFLITGILEIVLFARIGNKDGLGLWKMSIAIGLSFAFYLPVAIGAKKHPKLGILMIPKTLCYVWMICMGLNLIGKV